MFCAGMWYNTSLRQMCGISVPQCLQAHMFKDTSCQDRTFKDLTGTPTSAIYPIICAQNPIHEILLTTHQRGWRPCGIKNAWHFTRHLFLHNSPNVHHPILICRTKKINTCWQRYKVQGTGIKALCNMLTPLNIDHFN
jgi:hypothetical protein